MLENNLERSMLWDAAAIGIDNNPVYVTDK